MLSLAQGFVEAKMGRAFMVLEGKQQSQGDCGDSEAVTAHAKVCKLGCCMRLEI